MVFNYLPVTIGDSMDENGLKSCSCAFKTGFFSDVRLERDGDVLIVTVEERPTIALITFDGNRAIKTEDLEDGLAEAGFRGEVLIRKTRQSYSSLDVNITQTVSMELRLITKSRQLVKMPLR